MTPDLVILSVATLSFFIGGLAKGAIGIGLPWIAIPALTATGSLPLALSIAVPPVIATNLWQVWQFREHRNISFLPRFLFVGVLGLAAGTIALKNLPSAYLEILLGCMVLLFLFRQSTTAKEMSASRRQRLAPVLGGCAGLAHGALGLSGLVGPPFFQAAGLSRPAFIFSCNIMFILFSTLHMPALAAVGLYQMSGLVIGLFAMVPAFAGLWLGGRLGDRLKASTFPVIVRVMLAIAALLPIWNGISHLPSGP